LLLSLVVMTKMSDAKTMDEVMAEQLAAMEAANPENPLFAPDDDEEEDSSAGIAKSEFVVDITGKDVWEELVNDFEGVVITEHYSQSCPHCMEFAPIYAEFAESVKLETKVKIAKMDARANEETEEITEELEVEGFPTVFGWKDGVKYKYDGDRTMDSMYNFLSKVTGRPTQVASAEYMDKYASTAKLYVATAEMKLNEDGSFTAQQQAYIDLAAKIGEHLVFLWAAGEEDNIKVYGAREEASVLDKEILDPVEFEEWLWKQTVSPVSMYSERHLTHPYYKDYLVFFSVDSADETIAAINQAFIEASVDEACPARFIFADMRTIKEPFKIMADFGLDPETPLPALMGVTFKEGAYPAKYLYPSKIELTEKNIVMFCQVYLDGKAPRVFKTGAPQESEKDAILSTTSSSEFDKSIVESQVPSIVAFTKDGKIDRKIKKTANVLDFVKETFTQSELNLFTIDLSANEHEYFPFEQDAKNFPVLVVYGPGAAKGARYSYDPSNLCTESLRKFVEDNSAISSTGNDEL